MAGDWKAKADKNKKLIYFIILIKNNKKRGSNWRDPKGPSDCFWEINMDKKDKKADFKYQFTGRFDTSFSQKFMREYEKKKGL